MTEPQINDTLRLQKALSAIRSLRARVDELETSRACPIAVIGMSCRFPSAPNTDAFWQLLARGGSAIRDVPTGRWRDGVFCQSQQHTPGTTYCVRGGFVDGVDLFDAQFFGISPREAKHLDPQQRLLLEVSWEALEVAAINPARLAGTQTGVFVGISTAEYLQLMQRDSDQPFELYDLTGTESSVASGRLSYHLDLRGPNVAIDTACSSSLVAVHLAAASLRRGESNLALAGGVSLMLSPDASIAFCSAGALARDGLCKTFDASADGYSRGEGCGVVVLKRYADAVADGDRILAIIRGSAINHDGHTNGLAAPNGIAQQAVIRRALEDSRIAPADVGYVETHGTGTQLGDPIEVDALGEVFQQRSSPLVIGAVKTNIGHLEAAAGVAGLIKAIMLLQHGVIPPNLHFRQPSDKIPWSELPLEVPTQQMAWPEGGRAAGVSSFGFSGTNGHVILERAPSQSASRAPSDRMVHLLTLSAKSPDALTELARRYAQSLDELAEDAFADFCFTANTGRMVFPYRLAAVASSAGECAGQLAAFVEGKKPPGLSVGHSTKRPKIAFLFTGQGSQYIGMGRQLYKTNPVFRENMQRCERALRERGLLATPLLEVLYPPAGTAETERIDSTTYAQPALFALEYSLAELWRSWGIEPDVLLGHSTGELVAACVAGAFSLEDGLCLIARRAQLIEAASGDGATASVFAEADMVARVIAPLAGQVCVSGVNSPRETLIAGSRLALDQAMKALKSQGIDGRMLKIPHAPHSPLVESVLHEFEQFASGISFKPPRMKLISNVTGEPIDAVEAKYWRRHMREPVRFADGMAALRAENCEVILEVGPQPVLQLLGRQNWQGSDVTWLSSLWAIQDDWKQMLQCLAALHTRGMPIDWMAFDHGNVRRKVDLPTYPFQRSRYWFNEKKDPEAMAERNVPSSEQRLPILDELRERLAEYLQSDASRIETTASFIQLGADSLLIGRLVQDIEERYGLQIGIGRLFDDLDTLQTLVAYLEKHVTAESLATRTAPGTSDSTDANIKSTTRPAAVVQSEVTSLSPSPENSALQDIPVARIVADQLRVMERQLDVLARHLPSSSPSQTTARTVNDRSAAQRVAVASSREVRDLNSQQQQYLQTLIAEFTQRTAGSRRRAMKYRSQRVYTRLRTVRQEANELAYPIVGERASGARFWDIDGNEYVDLAMGVGTLLCGHCPPFIAEAIIEQTRKAVQTGPACGLADDVAAMICDMTNAERVFFSVTGSCAVRGALRIAQAATNRTKFAFFSGSYHGQDDRVLTVADPSSNDLRSMPMAVGISPSAAADTLVLPYDDPYSLRVIEQHASELAAVLVEPVQSRNPALQPREFLHQLRQLTERHGIPLIFDEVITGFRSHPGGAQALFDVKADITVYGKCIGGGLPVSVVAGKAKYLDRVDGGAWLNQPDSRPDFATTFIGSTFEMHPLTMATTRAMLDHLRKEGPALQERLNQTTSDMVDRLNAIFQDEQLPIRVMSFASMFRFVWKGNTSYTYQALEIELFHYHLIQSGIYIWEGRTCFLSTAHTPADIEAVIQSVRDAVQAMRTGGMLPMSKTSPSLEATAVGNHQPQMAPTSSEQQALWLVHQKDERDAPHWTVTENLRLRGQFNFQACQRAVGSLVGRHEALRTVFASAGKTQLIRSSLHFDVELIDLTKVAESDRDKEVRNWLQQELAKGFCLANGPLFRVFALKLDDNLHHLILVLHHIISDGWSMAILLEELASMYSAECLQQELTYDPPLQYRDYVGWQSQQNTADAGEAHRTFWSDRFRDGFPPTLLPTDHDRTDPVSNRGARVSMRLEEDLCRAIKEVARRHNCTLFMTLLGAYGLLIHRLTGQQELAIGTPTAGRSFKGSDSIVGYCSHLLPIRSRIEAEMTISDYLQSVRESVLGAFQHQDLDFTQIQSAVNPGQADAILPLQVVFNLDRSIDCPVFHGLDCEFRPVPACFALVDFRLDAIESDGGLWLDCDYRTDLFDVATVRMWCAYYRALLEAMVLDTQQAFASLCMAPRLSDVPERALNQRSERTDDPRNQS